MWMPYDYIRILERNLNEFAEGPDLSYKYGTWKSSL